MSHCVHSQTRRRLTGLALVLMAGSLGPTWLPAQDRSVGRIVGVAVDSLRGGVPLQGATLVLVASNRYASADSLGRFAFDSVGTGEQQIALLHPSLDALDLSLPPVSVTVAGSGDTPVIVAIPAMRAIHRMVCGNEAPPGSGLVIGTVARPAAHAGDTSVIRVDASWTDMVIEERKLVRVPRNVSLSPDVQGTFIMCEVPSTPRVQITAFVGADTIDVSTVTLGALGVARVELPVLRTVTLGADGLPVQQLAGVSVRASAVRSAPAVMGSYEGLEERRRMGLGAFRVVDDHARNSAQTLTDILSTMRGITTEGRGRARAPKLRGFHGGQCWPNYFVDGIYFKVESNAPPQPNPFTDLELFIPPSSITAVEVYSSPVGIPPTFDLSGHTGCGTILIWTNRGKANSPGA